MKRIVLFLLLNALAQSFQAQKESYRLLVGTYTNTGETRGIYSYEVNMKTGGVTQKSIASGLSNPSYLCISTDRGFVYSVNESVDASSANAFSFHRKTGVLTLLNRSRTNSKGSCYIVATDEHVFTANYGGGSISVFNRNTDGTLSDVKQLIKHQGYSLNLARQEAPHVHQVLVTPDRKYVLANDLGTDQTIVYQYHPLEKSKILTPCDTFFSKPGSGPRHATSSTNGKWWYLLHELNGSITVLSLKKGHLYPIHETVVPIDGSKTAWAADIHLSPDGKYLYSSNRAPANTISCFAVAKNGKLELKQQQPTLGDGPRNFAITPDGKYLFVGHQFSDSIVIFRRDTKNGKLTDTGKRIEIGAPVCLVFY
jgi:6-phosphogluconolactonase